MNEAEGDDYNNDGDGDGGIVRVCCYVHSVLIDVFVFRPFVYIGRFYCCFRG
jgi:hypothetical protein